MLKYGLNWLILFVVLFNLVNDCVMKKIINDFFRWICWVCFYFCIIMIFWLIMYCNVLYISI